MKNIIKKVFAVVIVAIGAVVVIAPEAPAQAQPAPAYFCCDAGGYHRCTINPSYPGTSCYCYGQGYGYACY